MDITTENATQPAQGAPQADLSDLLTTYGGVLLRRWWIIALTTIGFLLLGVVYLQVTKRSYFAVSGILVDQQGGRPLSVPSDNNRGISPAIEDHVPTQAQVLASAMVVSRAIEDIGLENLPTLKLAKEKGLNPVEEAIEALSVDRPDRMAKVLRIGYKADSREEAVQTVEAIITSYQSFLRESNQASTGKLEVLISQARDILDKELGALEREYLAFRQESKTLVTSDKDGRSYLTRRLELLDASASESKLKAIRLHTQLEVGQTLARQGAGMWAIAHAMQKLGEPASAQESTLIAGAAGMSQVSAMDFIRQLTQEQQQLSERFGPANVRVQEIKEQIQRITEGNRESRKGVEQAEVHDLLASVEESLKAIKGLSARIDSEFQGGLKEAKQYETELLADVNYRNNLERHRLLFNTVVEQLRQAQFSGDYSTITAHVVERPNSPRKAYSPKTTLTLLVAILFGLMAGIPLVLLAEHWDQRIRSVGEVRKLFGTAELAQIPMIPGEQLPNGGDPGLICQYQPRSPWADAFGLARTNLELRRRGRPARVIVVTSPGKGDGKTTVASNLAAVMALGGRRVLLIDADLRDPKAHALYGIPRDRGLTQVLANQLAANQAIARTSMANLHVMGPGPEVPSPAQRLGSPGLAELLVHLRDSYDAVVIDAPPMLSAADASVLGAASDGILLVLRPETLRRPDALSVLSQIELLGLPVVGTLLNGVAFRSKPLGEAEVIEPAFFAPESPTSPSLTPLPTLEDLVDDGRLRLSDLPGNPAFGNGRARASWASSNLGHHAEGNGESWGWSTPSSPR